ncbi:outer membrane protein transport protein [bacterium]|nr:outer membrane protein transport protein [candidate division CSSED10-310 bacterium]
MKDRDTLRPVAILSRWFLPSVLLLLVGMIQILTGRVVAGGFSVLDIGMRRCTMMAVMADADEPAAIYHNPACLDDQNGTQLYMCTQMTHVETRVRMRQDDDSLSGIIDPELSDGAAPFIGMTSDFGLERWTFGTALYFPNLYGVALPEDAVSRYHVYRALFASGYLTTAASYHVSDSISIGASASYIYVYLMGKRKFDLLGAYDPDTDFDMSITSDEQTASWSLSLRYKPTRRMRLGIAYVPRTDLRLEGDLDVDYPNRTRMVHTDITTSMIIPASWRMGASYWLNDRWQVALDFNLWEYSDYDAQTIETGMDDLFGDQSTAKNYHDSYSVALGLQVQPSRAGAVMFGLLRDWSPIPTDYYSLDNPNTDNYSVSGGYRRILDSGNQFTIGGAMTYYEAVDVTESKTNPPTNAKGFGYSYELTAGYLYRF